MKSLLYIMLFTLITTSLFAAEKLNVTVTIAPQKFIVEQITKDRANVNVLVPENADPHTFSLKPQQAKMLDSSKIYFKIGFPIEKQIEEKLNKDKKLTIVNAARGVDYISETHAHEDDHGHKDEHEGDEYKEGLDVHIWTSPKQMLIVAANTIEALEKVDPENALFYKANYHQLVTKINEYDKKFTELFAKPGAMKKFAVFHPSWGYFANDYDLEQISIEIEGKSPKPAELKKTLDLIKNEKVTVFIAQPKDPKSQVDVVTKELGLKAVYANPLQENWFDSMDTFYTIFSKNN